MKFVNNIRTWWRWFTTWLLATNGTFIATYESFQTVREFIPESVAHWIVFALLALTGLARIIKQRMPPA